MKSTAESYRKKATELERLKGPAGIEALEAAARAAWAIAAKEAQLNEAAAAARKLQEAAAKASKDLAAQEAAYKEARAPRSTAPVALPPCRRSLPQGRSPQAILVLVNHNCPGLFFLAGDRRCKGRRRVVQGGGLQGRG